MDTADSVADDSEVRSCSPAVRVLPEAALPPRPDLLMPPSSQSINEHAPLDLNCASSSSSTSSSASTDRDDSGRMQILLLFLVGYAGLAIYCVCLSSGMQSGFGSSGNALSTEHDSLLSLLAVQAPPPQHTTADSSHRSWQSLMTSRVPQRLHLNTDLHSLTDLYDAYAAAAHTCGSGGGGGGGSDACLNEKGDRDHDQVGDGDGDGDAVLIVLDRNQHTGRTQAQEQEREQERRPMTPWLWFTSSPQGRPQVLCSPYGDPTATASVPTATAVTATATRSQAGSPSFVAENRACADSAFAHMQTQVAAMEAAAAAVAAAGEGDAHGIVLRPRLLVRITVINASDRHFGACVNKTATATATTTASMSIASPLNSPELSIQIRRALERQLLSHAAVMTATAPSAASAQPALFGRARVETYGDVLPVLVGDEQGSPACCSGGGVSAASRQRRWGRVLARVEDYYSPHATSTSTAAADDDDDDIHGIRMESASMSHREWLAGINRFCPTPEACSRHHIVVVVGQGDATASSPPIRAGPSSSTSGSGSTTSRFRRHSSHHTTQIVGLQVAVGVSNDSNSSVAATAEAVTHSIRKPINMGLRKMLGLSAEPTLGVGAVKPSTASGDRGGGEGEEGGSASTSLAAVQASVAGWLQPHRSSSVNSQSRPSCVHVWELLWLQWAHVRALQQAAAALLLASKLSVEAAVSTSSTSTAGLSGYNSSDGAGTDTVQWTPMSPHITIALSDTFKDSYLRAASLLAQSLQTPPHPPSLNSHSYGQAQRSLQLALSLSRDPSLLPVAHFPTEQVLSVYAPFWVPLAVPLLKAIISVVRSRWASRAAERAAERPAERPAAAAAR